MKKHLIVMTAALTLMAVPSAAQQATQDALDQYIELVRMDVRQERAEIVGESMRLSAGEASRFWPIYEEYEAAYTALGDTKLRLIRDYAGVFYTMTNAAADNLVERLFRLNEDEQALIREYHGKVASAVGGAVAGCWLGGCRRTGSPGGGSVLNVKTSPL